MTLSRFVDDIEQGELAVVPGDFVRTERRALDWQNDFDLVRGLEITAGLAINREETTGRSFGTPLEGAPGAGEASRDEEAGYVQAGLEAAGQRLVAAGRRTRHETFGSVNTWNLEWGTDITPVLLLRAEPDRRKHRCRHGITEKLTACPLHQDRHHPTPEQGFLVGTGIKGDSPGK